MRLPWTDTLDDEDQVVLYGPKVKGGIEAVSHTSVSTLLQAAVLSASASLTERAVIPVSSDFGATPGVVYLIDASSGAVSVELPGESVGVATTFIKVDSSANAVNFTGTVNGSTSKSIGYQWTALSMISDGTDWYVI